jgi:Tfp pilus assembly protein PilF
MPIYEVGSQSGRPFFSMKLMEGGTLAEHLPRFAGDGRAAAELLIKVARAVHHAHLRGILHRDLKPANILLDAQGEPFVTDFGLCRRVEVDSGMTQSGVIVGTPSYMSPEQAAGRKGLTTATDVYSLGAVLYALLTDRPPFRGNTPLETVRGVLEDEPSRPRLLRPQVDRDLETICLKCLEKQPDRRYRSAESVADDLERWLAGEPIVARRTSVWERAWKRARRNPAAAALVAVSSLALVFLIAAGLIYQENRLTVAEQALARVSRIEELQSRASSHLGQAAANLAKRDAEGARYHARLASDQVANEPELQATAREAERLLAQAELLIELEQARAAALASVDRFQAHCDDVLYFGSPFASELPASHEAANAAAAAALAEVGLTPDGAGKLRLHPALSDEEARSFAASCHEVLLMVAAQSAGRIPPDLELSARLKEQANLVRTAFALPAADNNFLLGYEAWRRRDSSAAERALRAAIREQPRNVWARCLLAACYLPTNPREAETHLSMVIDERPTLYLAYLLRGIACANLHDDQAAESDFTQALARAPAKPADFRYSVLITRGEWRRQRQLHLEAERDLMAAIAIKPISHLAPLHLAKVYQDRRKATEAAVQLDRALTAEDLTPAVEAAILLYRAANATRDRDAALADLYRSLDIHPYAEAFVQLANERLRRKNLTGEDYYAIAEWCDYAFASPAYSPDSYEVSRTHYLRAFALVALEDYETAAHALDFFVAAGGKPDGEIQRLRGAIRAWHKDFPKAIELLSDSLAQDPRNPDTLAERGSVYLAMGALDVAADDFRAALAADATLPNALAGRGMIRAMRGDHEGAEEDAERAWAFGPQTQRYAWMAARTLAIVHGRLQSRGSFVSVEESKDMVRYRQRAIALLEQALLRAPPEKRPSLWREAIEEDVWFPLLSDQPAFRELKRKYAPSIRPAPAL